MKQINKTLGVISIIVLFVGVLFKRSHWQGASVLLTLGALAVIAFFIVYLSVGIKQLSTELEKSYGIIGGISICISLLGLLWKMQHWPRGNIFVFISIGGLLVTSVLLIIDSIKETDQNKQSIKTLFAFILVVLAIFLTMLAPTIEISKYI
jgi:uncharacterized membrane protein